MKTLKHIMSILLAAAVLLASGAGLFAVPAQAADGNWVTSWGSSLVNGSVSVSNLCSELSGTYFPTSSHETDEHAQTSTWPSASQITASASETREARLMLMRKSQLPCRSPTVT